MVEHVKGMTIDEFIRVYDQEGPFELIDGEQRPMSPPVAGHGSALIRWLCRIGKANPSFWFQTLW